MRLVSMSLYSRLDKRNASLTVYRQALDQLFKTLVPAAPQWHNRTMMPDDLLDSTPLIIIVSAAKGLCGSFHTNLIRYYERLFFAQEHQSVNFIAVGNKAINFVTESIKRDKRGTLIANYPEINSNNLETIALSIYSAINSHRPRCSSVTCYSNEFVNFFKQKPLTTTLIPLLSAIKTAPSHEASANGHDGPGSNEPHEAATPSHDYIWEQEPVVIVDKLSERYLKTSLMHLLLQSLLAEQASRFVAMDSATTNAEKYLEKLTLQYNKMRQALITKEVSELTAGL